MRLNVPDIAALNDARTILLIGMGGGYDIFCGLPLRYALQEIGKTVHLANLSFSRLDVCDARHIGEAVVKVTHETTGGTGYFPERYLCEWFHSRGETVPVYCFPRVGARPIAAAYQNLVAELGGSRSPAGTDGGKVDAVVLIDGGTDSLMRGDECGLGTPEEDSVSLYAVNRLEDVATKLLVCIGFGVDTFHGVSHGHFLEAVAALSQDGAFLGAWSLLPEMPEAELYKEAVEFVHEQMFNHPSIVNTSILSAVEGQFGNYHANYRTDGSDLFINPLMSLYWAFDAVAVAERNLYLDLLATTETVPDVWKTLAMFRANVTQREWLPLPM